MFQSCTIAFFIVTTVFFSSQSVLVTNILLFKYLLYSPSPPFPTMSFPQNTIQSQNGASDLSATGLDAGKIGAVIAYMGWSDWSNDTMRPVRRGGEVQLRIHPPGPSSLNSSDPLADQELAY